MIDKVLISTEELKKFYVGNTVGDKARSLLKQQMVSWQMLSDNYKQLNNVKVKEFDFEGFKIKVQFNPGRITSSSAKVDTKSIKERKCFLCIENLPEQQRGIEFNDYTILCNPFPIFPEHFTIPKKSHTPQNLLVNFSDMLKLTKALGEHYSVFYNGPKCGASAPDHMHFQAGTKYFMPLESDYENYISENKNIIISKNDFSLFSINSYLRNILVIESSVESKIIELFDNFYSAYEKLSDNSEEPMMNVIASFENGMWRIYIVPREKHRPDYYFAEGKDNILLSPASVDIGGVCITPLEKDFNKITKENIESIFKQVCLSDEKFESLVKNLKQGIL
jgi:ATP adenylyltransferase/5',5'''-P-1,P-4-tetraphosphate phosphorylase II